MAALGDKTHPPEIGFLRLAGRAFTIPLYRKGKLTKIGYILLSFVMTIAGFNSYYKFKSSEKVVFDSLQWTQSKSLGATAESDLPEEIRFSLPEYRHFKQGSTEIRLLIGINRVFRLLVLISERETTVVIQDGTSNQKISDFSVSTELPPKGQSRYRISVVLGKPTLIRILDSHFGEDRILIEKTVDFSTEPRSEALPVTFRVLNQANPFQTRVSIGSYEYSGDFNLPPLLTDSARAGLTGLAVAWIMSQLFTIRRRKIDQC